MGKMSFFAGVAVGYVLGSRAGRERYEQLRRRADQVWSSEPVQTRVEAAKESVVTTVKEQAPVVAHKLQDAAKAGAAKVTDTVGSSDDAASATSANGSSPATRSSTA